MSESPNLKKRDFLIPHEDYVDKSKISIVDEKNGNYTVFSSTHESIHVRYTAHHLKWSWRIQGTTQRKAEKVVRMKNWLRRFYTFKGAKVIVNASTLEIWLRSRYYNPTRRASSVMRLIYANWSKADRLAREFSEYAQIGLKPIKSDHPADIQHAHLVMTTKALNPILKPMSAVKDDVGLIFDKSHPNKPEFVGQKAVEGAHGAEWFFVKFPNDFSQFVQTMFEYRHQLELHLKVEQGTLDTQKEMRDTMLAIRKLLEKK